MKPFFSKVCKLSSTSMFSELLAGESIPQVKCCEAIQYMNRAEAMVRVLEPLQQDLLLLLFLRQFGCINPKISVAYPHKHLLLGDYADPGRAYLRISPSDCHLGSIVSVGLRSVLPHVLCGSQGKGAGEIAILMADCEV